MKVPRPAKLRHVDHLPAEYYEGLVRRVSAEKGKVFDPNDPEQSESLKHYVWHKWNSDEQRRRVLTGLSHWNGTKVFKLLGSVAAEEVHPSGIPVQEPCITINAIQSLSGDGICIYRERGQECRSPDLHGCEADQLVAASAARLLADGKKVVESGRAWRRLPSDLLLQLHLLEIADPSGSGIDGLRSTWASGEAGFVSIRVRGEVARSLAADPSGGLRKVVERTFLRGLKRLLRRLKAVRSRDDLRSFRTGSAGESIEWVSALVHLAGEDPAAASSIDLLLGIRVDGYGLHVASPNGVPGWFTPEVMRLVSHDLNATIEDVRVFDANPQAFVAHASAAGDVVGQGASVSVRARARNRYEEVRAYVKRRDD